MKLQPGGGGVAGGGSNWGPGRSGGPSAGEQQGEGRGAGPPSAADGLSALEVMNRRHKLSRTRTRTCFMSPRLSLISIRHFLPAEAKETRFGQLGWPCTLTGPRLTLSMSRVPSAPGSWLRPHASLLGPQASGASRSSRHRRLQICPSSAWTHHVAISASVSAASWGSAWGERMVPQMP